MALPATREGLLMKKPFEKPFDLSPRDFFAVIDRSNRNASENRNKYPLMEERAIQKMYNFVGCPCAPTCKCQVLGCCKHYVIKADTEFTDYLQCYVKCWVDSRQQTALLDGVNGTRIYEGRAKKAVPVLKDIGYKWPSLIGAASSQPLTLVCDGALEKLATWVKKIPHLYEAKAISLLYYDLYLPYDTRSQVKLRQYYSREYLPMHREIRDDLLNYLRRYKLSLEDFRKFDVPGTYFPDLRSVSPCRPISRVIDKAFYVPGNTTAQEC
jgi:hypothetical protein